MPERLCSRCGEAKSRDQFYRDRSSSDGLRSYCKACHNAAIKASRTPEKRREESRRRRERDAEAIRIYQRDWIANNPDKRRERNRKFRSNHPEKARAHNIINKAIGRGALTRPQTCESCSNENRIEAHHADYAEPYAVQWLCKRCHGEADRARV